MTTFSKTHAPLSDLHPSIPARYLDRVNLYRLEEELAAKARVATIEAECAERIQEARAECRRTMEEIIAERLRLRSDTSLFDPVFYNSIFGNLREGDNA